MTNGQDSGASFPAPSWSPSWSPDGTKIVYTWTYGDREEIYVIGADGRGRKRLTANGFSDSRPSWSLDGTKIAFTSDRDGDAEIYLMNADGSDPVRLTFSGGSDHSPAWSPDGGKIAFVSDRDGDEEIYLMNADGSHPANVTRHEGNDREPSFSMDGTQLAFTSDRDGNREIYTVKVDGSDPSRLTHHPRDDFFPSWGRVQGRALSGASFGTVTFTVHRYDKKATASIGFDDCVIPQDLISEMYMKQYNMQGTLFTNGKRTLERDLSEAAQEIHRSGTLEVACHTWSHTYPKVNPTMTQREWEEGEVARNKAFLDRLLGKETTGFAYPWGGPSAIRYAEVVQRYYLFGRTTAKGDTRYAALQYPEMNKLALTESGMSPGVFNRAASTGGWYRSFYHSWGLDWGKFSEFLKWISGRPEVYYGGYEAAVEYHILQQSSRYDGMSYDDQADVLTFRTFTVLPEGVSETQLNTPVTVKVNLDEEVCHLRVNDGLMVMVDGIRTPVHIVNVSDGMFWFEVPVGEHDVLIRRGSSPLIVDLSKPVISDVHSDGDGIVWRTDDGTDGIVYYSERTVTPIWDWKILGRDLERSQMHRVEIPRGIRIARYAVAGNMFGLVDATSLLWRMELVGVDTGPRMQSLVS